MLVSLKVKGYDVDCHPPAFVSYDFYAEDPKYWKSEEYVYEGVQFAFNEINAQAQKHGEMYELLDVVRVVDSNPHRCVLFTFNVREIAPSSDVVKTIQAMVFMATRDHNELVEWRFRPGPPETPPEIPPETPPGTHSDTSSDTYSDTSSEAYF